MADSKDETKKEEQQGMKAPETGQQGTEIAISQNGLGDSVSTSNLQTDSSINVNVAAKFTILKTDLVAALKKTGNNWKMLVAPTDAVANQGMTIGEIVEEIKSLMGGSDEAVAGLNEQLENEVSNMASDNQKGGFDPKSIKLYLRQVFVYYEKNESTSGTEYAFSLEIDTSQMLKKIGMFNLEGIVFAVWNTKRSKVKESMAMFDVDEYLAALE